MFVFLGHFLHLYCMRYELSRLWLTVAVPDMSIELLREL